MRFQLVFSVISTDFKTESTEGGFRYGRLGGFPGFLGSSGAEFREILSFCKPGHGWCRIAKATDRWRNELNPMRIQLVFAVVSTDSSTNCAEEGFGDVRFGPCVWRVQWRWMEASGRPEGLPVLERVRHAFPDLRAPQLEVWLIPYGC